MYKFFFKKTPSRKVKLTMGSRWETRWGDRKLFRGVKSLVWGVSCFKG